MPESPRRIAVLIVDDSAIVRETLQEVLSSDRDIEVIGTAADPYIAAMKMLERKPDVVVLDINMPRMDGLTFLRKIMVQHPMPVVICSSLTEEGADETLRALEYGAVDIITKPKVGAKRFFEESQIRICDSVKAAAQARLGTSRRSLRLNVEPKLTADVILEPPVLGARRGPSSTIVAIGASTGGTEAITTVLRELPCDFPGTVIVQHMPEHFTAAFAKRLDSLCSASVKEAEDGDQVIAGRILIAPGDRHTMLKRVGDRYHVEVIEGALVCRHRPSVDVLFRSTAVAAGSNGIGVIMTGMGDDGARGMKEMHDAGAFTIAQDEESSVVWGMPAEAIKLGGVERTAALDDIGRTLKHRVTSAGR